MSDALGAADQREGMGVKGLELMPRGAPAAFRPHLPVPPLKLMRAACTGGGGGMGQPWVAELARRICWGTDNVSARL